MKRLTLEERAQIGDWLAHARLTNRDDAGDFTKLLAAVDRITAYPTMLLRTSSTSWLAAARLAYQSLRCQVDELELEWASPGTDRVCGSLKFEASLGAFKACQDEDAAGVGEAERMIEVWTAVLKKALVAEQDGPLAPPPELCDPCDACGAPAGAWCSPTHAGEREPIGWTHPNRGAVAVTDRSADARKALAWARRAAYAPEQTGPSTELAAVARGILQLAGDRQRLKEERFGMSGGMSGGALSNLAQRDKIAMRLRRGPTRRITVRPMLNDTTPIGSGCVCTVAMQSPRATIATAIPVADHGDGTYSFELPIVDTGSYRFLAERVTNAGAISATTEITVSDD